jgi:serine/threonine-protein kinase
MVGWAWYYSGPLEKAVKFGKRLIELEPAFFGGHAIVGSTLLVEKKYAEARKEIEIAVKLNYSFITMSAIGFAAGLAEDETRAREAIKEMEVLSKTQVLSNYSFGMAHTFLGEFDTAARFFEKGIENREGLMLFAKSNILLLDKNYYHPKIESVLNKMKPLNVN